MTDSRTILCVYHASRRDDRVSRMLAERGLILEWVNPARGEPLPDDPGAYLGAVVYGGEQSVNDDTAEMQAERRWMTGWIERDGAVLGLCLGGQLIAAALGARVGRHADGLLESGYTLIRPDGTNGVVREPMYVFQWHNEGFELPPDCRRLATGARCENQAFSYRAHIVGLQFHPEVTSAIMVQWFHEGGHMLTDPGAHPAETQLRDARVFEPAVEAWTGSFLDTWLEHCRNAPSTRGS